MNIISVTVEDGEGNTLTLEGVGEVNCILPEDVEISWGETLVTKLDNDGTYYTEGPDMQVGPVTISFEQDVQSVAEEAMQIVHGKRKNDYGTPEENHGRTARLWNAYIYGKYPDMDRFELTPEDVCFMNLLQKISRHMNRPTRDNLVDIIGYAINVAILEGFE